MNGKLKTTEGERARKKEIENKKKNRKSQCALRNTSLFYAFNDGGKGGQFVYSF